MKWIVSLGLLTVVATACTDDTSIDPADYDRHCTDKNECVVVTVGNMCETSCEEAAIRFSELARYRADRDAIVCPEEGGGFWVDLCTSHEPLCVDGLCVAY